MELTQEFHQRETEFAKERKCLGCGWLPPRLPRLRPRPRPRKASLCRARDLFARSERAFSRRD